MKRRFVKRKDTFIINAIDLLDEQGILGLTTRELAKREGVTEPALYRQFKSKNDLILSMLDEFLKYDRVIANTITEQEIEPVRAIYYFVSAYADYYQSYPQITTLMLSFDSYKYEKEANEKMMHIIKNRQQVLEQIISKGQEKGEIKASLSPDAMAEVILGIIWSMVYFWKMNDTSENLKEKINRAIKLIL